MNMNYFKVIVAATAVVLFASVSVRAAMTEDVRQVSGEITWIDLKLGELQLKSDASPGEITEYRITEHETRVTNASDEKFLSVGDLQPGQHVIVDVVKGEEEKIIQKITADPRPTYGLQEAYGEIDAIDASAGTLTLEGRPRAGEVGGSNLSYFVFEPQNIIAMQSPSKQPIQLELKPGDLVKVEYKVSDGKQRAQSITMYPQITSTTTTTTTTTTR